MSRTLRSRTGIGAGAMIALCLAALSASAQERPVTSRQDRGDTVKINFSGDIVMDMVYRSPELTFMTDSYTGPGNPQETDGETTAEGWVTLRFDAELSDKISAVVELQHKRVDGGIDEFTGSTSPEIDLRTAFVKIQDFLTGGLQAKFGLVDWSFDVRGKGSSFAFDPRNSQQINRNIRVMEDSVGGWAGRGAAPNALEPVGGVLSYMKDAWTLELVLLPVIDEGGNPSFDESLYAVDFWYRLDDSVGKGSRIGMILAVSGLNGSAATDNHETAMVTVGAGVNLVFQGGIELYAEGYLQNGKVGRNVVDGDDVKAKGHAFQVGLDYHLQGNENNIWFGVNLTVISGDDDDQNTDDNANAFVSYENVNDLLILEDQYFGIDMDTNYTAFKIKGGITFGKLDLTAIIGIVNATQELVNGVDDEKRIGNELDVRARYNLNKQVALTAQIGVLVSSDVLEEAMGASGDAEDRAAVGSVGFDVRY